MFGRKSYSDKALTLAAAALEVVDARITWDLIDQKPEGYSILKCFSATG